MGNNEQSKGAKKKIKDSRIAELIKLLPKPFSKKSSKLHYNMTGNIAVALSSLEKAALKLAADVKTAKDDLKQVDQKLFDWCSASQRWDEDPRYGNEKLDLLEKVKKLKSEYEAVLKTFKPARGEVHEEMSAQSELQEAYEALKRAEENPELREYDLQKQ